MPGSGIGPSGTALVILPWIPFAAVRAALRASEKYVCGYDRACGRRFRALFAAEESGMHGTEDAPFWVSPHFVSAGTHIFPRSAGFSAEVSSDGADTAVFRDGKHICTLRCGALGTPKQAAASLSGFLSSGECPKLPEEKPASRVPVFSVLAFCAFLSVWANLPDMFPGTVIWRTAEVLAAAGALFSGYALPFIIRKKKRTAAPLFTRAAALYPVWFLFFYRLGVLLLVSVSGG